MERLFRKFEQRFKRAQESVERWGSLQEQLVRLSANAAAVIQRIPLLLDGEKYGALQGLEYEVVSKQAESAEKIFIAMRETLLEFENVCTSLEKLWRDGNNLLRNEKPKPTAQQVQQRVGSRASLEDCVQGLRDLYIMHRDEYALKVDIVSSLTYDTKADDISALQAVLVDQPNIPPEEVHSIFSLICAGSS